MNITTFRGSSCPHWAFPLLLCLQLFYLFPLQLFPDAGNNAVVVSLQDGPVVSGDVKVMFESSAVSFPPRLKNGPTWDCFI